MRASVASMVHFLVLAQLSVSFIFIVICTVLFLIDFVVLFGNDHYLLVSCTLPLSNFFYLFGKCAILMTKKSLYSNLSNNSSL